MARAFATRPDLLLMDEPYGQLDVQLRYYLEDELIRLWEKLKITVIFVTHNIEEAVYLADRILVLSNKPTGIKGNLESSCLDRGIIGSGIHRDPEGGNGHDPLVVAGRFRLFGRQTGKCRHG